MTGHSETGMCLTDVIIRIGTVLGESGRGHTGRVGWLPVKFNSQAYVAWVVLPS